MRSIPGYPSRPSRDEVRRPPDERVGVGVGLNAGDGGSSLMLLRDVDSLGVEPTGVRLSTPPFKGGCVERLAALPPAGDAAAAARDGDPNRGGFGGVTSLRDAGLP